MVRVKTTKIILKHKKANVCFKTVIFAVTLEEKFTIAE